MPNETPKKRSSVLLLLPPPPSPLYPNLEAAYSAAISSVLSSVSAIASKSLSTMGLEIAVPCPHPIYPQTHKLVAGLYRLISAICARDSIDTEGEGGVDTRILLIAYPKDEGSSKLLQGPVIDLPALALSQRVWQHVFSVYSEEGELLLKEFLRSVEGISHGASQPHWDVKRVHAGVSATSLAAEVVQPLECRQKRHYSVAVGGTFDHLHAGHK